MSGWDGGGDWMGRVGICESFGESQRLEGGNRAVFCPSSLDLTPRLISKTGCDPSGKCARRDSMIHDEKGGLSFVPSPWLSTPN